MLGLQREDQLHRGQRDLAAAVALGRRDLHEPAARERVDHARYPRRVEVVEVRELALGARPVPREVREQLGLAGAQPHGRHVRTHDLALDVAGAVQQGAGAGVLAIENVNNGKSIAGTATGGGNWNLGRLSMVRTDARDIVVSGTGISATGYGAGQAVAEATLNLRDVTGSFDKDVRSASGGNFNGVLVNEGLNLGAGVTSLRGAMVTMDIAESAQKILDRIRADLGSVQGQMVSTVNNITVTQVNVKAAESQIREVDFAAESSEFSKLNILAQSGSYALSQANAVQQNILRLLN